MKKLKLYFAHNFNNRKEFRQLELKLEEELGIELLNPFYDVPERKEEMDALDSGRVNKWCVDDPAHLVARDLINIDKCDGIFTFVEKPSFGTAFEIAYCKQHNKPVYFISELYADHPWIKIYTTHKFKTLEAFKKHIKESYGKKEVGNTR